MEAGLILLAVTVTLMLVKFYFDFEISITQHESGGFTVRFGFSLKKT